MHKRQYYQQARTEMLQFLPSNYYRVLEIGCGEGAFAMSLCDNCELWGVEMDENAALVAQKRMHRVLCGEYAQVSAQLPDTYFDVVVCNDVIEHIFNLDAFLASIRTKLCDSGYLVASVPNVRYLENLYELLVRKDWRYCDAGILDRTHVRFFTEKSLRRMLGESGFKVELMRGINRASNPFGRKLRGRLVWCFMQTVGRGWYGDIQYLQFGVRARKH